MVKAFQEQNKITKIAPCRKGVDIHLVILFFYYCPGSINLNTDFEGQPFVNTCTKKSQYRIGADLVGLWGLPCKSPSNPPKLTEKLDLRILLHVGRGSCSSLSFLSTSSS